MADSSQICLENATVLADNEGAISAILIVLKANSWGSKTILNGLVKALPDTSFWVKSSDQHTSDTRIGGIIKVDNGSLTRFEIPYYQEKILSKYNEAGFADKLVFREWLISNLPYSNLYSKINLNQGKGVEHSFDLMSLDNLDSRLAKCLVFHKQFPNLDFIVDKKNSLNYWRGETSGNEIKICSNTPSWDCNLNHNAGKTRINCLNAFNTAVNLFKLNWDERLSVPTSEITKNRKIEWQALPNSDSDRIETMAREVRKWPQDQFVVRKSSKGCKLSMPQQDFQKDSLLRQYCELTFPSNDDFSWQKEKDRLKIQGGNMHVCGNLVFVGRDAVKYYCSESEWNNQTFDWESCSEQILIDVFGTHQENHHLVWVGVPKRGLDKVNKDFQPVYHIDLFLHPFGFFPDANGQLVFRYIFARPKIGNIIPTVSGKTPKILSDLFKRFSKTQKSIKKQLKQLKIQSKPIFMEMPVRFVDFDNSLPMKWSDVSLKPLIDTFWSFANGLITEKDDKLQFLLAHYYSVGRALPQVIKSERKAHKKIKKAIPGITIVPIEGLELEEDRKGGLRCNVKVLARSFKEFPA